MSECASCEYFRCHGNRETNEYFYSVCARVAPGRTRDGIFPVVNWSDWCGEFSNSLSIPEPDPEHGDGWYYWGHKAKRGVRV